MASRLAGFIAELRRRHVLRALAAYAVVAFVVLQAGEIILPAFEAPAWVLQLLVVLAALGFPIVMAVAWIYALTPKGLERTDVLDAEAGLDQREPSVLPQLALALATLVVMGAAGLWFVRQPPADASELAGSALLTAADADVPITAIAVLPLADYSPEGTQDYFAASMHEELVAQLSRISSLRVVSRTSMAQYAGTDKLAPEIGRELGVQGIVEGSVTRADGRVRITVQLIHAPTDAHLWANSYERELKDILALQAEVAAEVVRAIEGEIAGTASVQRLAMAPVDPAAMDAYMQAHFEQEVGTPEALEAAAGHFSQAVGIDSTFAAAMAGLAGTRFLIGIQGDSVRPEMLREAQRHAQRALALDEGSNEARAVLLAVEERMGELGDRLEVSVGVDVPLDSLEMDYLRRYTDFGRKAREVMVVRAGPQQQPPSAWALGTAQGLLAEGQHGRAAELLEAVVESEPRLTIAWDALERSYALAGDFDRVVETRRRRIRATRGPALAEASIASLDAAVAGGDTDAYWEWLREDHLARLERGEYTSEVEYAAACVALGEHEDAINALRAALAKRERGLVTLRTDPVWDPLRTDPRFHEIVSSLSRPPRGAPPAGVRVDPPQARRPPGGSGS